MEEGKVTHLRYTAEEGVVCVCVVLLEFGFKPATSRRSRVQRP